MKGVGVARGGRKGGEDRSDGLSAIFSYINIVSLNFLTLFFSKMNLYNVQGMLQKLKSHDYIGCIQVRISVTVNKLLLNQIRRFFLVSNGGMPGCTYIAYSSLVVAEFRRRETRVSAGNQLVVPAFGREITQIRGKFVFGVRPHPLGHRNKPDYV